MRDETIFGIDIIIVFIAIIVIRGIAKWYRLRWARPRAYWQPSAFYRRDQTEVSSFSLSCRESLARHFHHPLLKVHCLRHPPSRSHSDSNASMIFEMTVSTRLYLAIVPIITAPQEDLDFDVITVLIVAGVAESTDSWLVSRQLGCRSHREGRLR